VGRLVDALSGALGGRRSFFVRRFREGALFV
jgi:hypothetical protein